MSGCWWAGLPRRLRQRALARLVEGDRSDRTPAPPVAGVRRASGDRLRQVGVQATIERIGQTQGVMVSIDELPREIVHDPSDAPLPLEEILEEALCELRGESRRKVELRPQQAIRALV